MTSEWPVVALNQLYDNQAIYVFSRIAEKFE